MPLVPVVPVAPVPVVPDTAAGTACAVQLKVGAAVELGLPLWEHITTWFFATSMNHVEIAVLGVLVVPLLLGINGMYASVPVVLGVVV